MSRLEFGSRLLDLAEDQSLPILERCKFIAIFADMIDEFFQVRVVSLEDKVAAGVQTPSVDGVRPRQQLADIRERVLALVERQDRLVLDVLLPELAAAGLSVVRYGDITDEERLELIDYFEQHVYPVLTPLAVDPGHPFPMISNLSLNIAVTVSDEHTGEERNARIKVPSSLPRFKRVGSGRWVMLEDLIMSNLRHLFPGMTVGRADLFRVTRNADLALEEDEADDLLVALEVELRRRRFGEALRVEIQSGMSPDFLELLVSQLDLDRSNVYVTDAPLGLHDFWSLYAIDRPELKGEGWSPLTPRRLLDGDHVGDVFGAMREDDILLHHPYDSFSDSVEIFIDQAAHDPDVVAIKQTLYRTSGDSPIVASLIHAAEQGKQVVALVELKARFDEAANIEWAKALEDSGVHVVYGIVGLKTHCKTALVVRNEGEATTRYVHIASGNYNSKTARNYEDFGLLTSNPAITRDVGELFNFLTGFSKNANYEKIVVSPFSVRERMVEMIARQATRGRSGRILMKTNGLTDPTVIDALYAASNAGVEIRLQVRTLCCLRPGIAGLSENITVQSLVGEFLEHSRLFIFGRPGEEDFSIHMGSADVMERNLDRRVEVLVPIETPSLQNEILEAFDVTWRDDCFTWVLGTDRRWRRLQSVNGFSAQSEFKRLATLRSRSLPLRA
ncbi:MAG: polyphosphate kinase 1 [Acidobacteriota bacterium]|nr:polyphosphate kinase 1 [Acidobacteriota bacterium]MDE3030108.1 polyphosphate kinase 1 [Acidobacteriota bacterium]MDE3092288.1 polyphosphate kinase 1 [Acidobacteriota bacterium]MDE3138876.1 polyphosphate kinase 1 [Acidobacteriota bacterium]MDE3146090.1 polyphosphate kinase 1 [Acidobacteriota bacterium]